MAPVLSVDGAQIGMPKFKRTSNEVQARRVAHGATGGCVEGREVSQGLIQRWSEPKHTWQVCEHLVAITTTCTHWSSAPLVAHPYAHLAPRHSGFSHPMFRLPGAPGHKRYHATQPELCTNAGQLLHEGRTIFL